MVFIMKEIYEIETVALLFSGNESKQVRSEKFKISAYSVKQACEICKILFTTENPETVYAECMIVHYCTCNGKTTLEI